MKILHITETMGQGGAERHLANLFKHLHDAGITNELVTLWPGLAYQDQLNESSTTIECLQIKGRNILFGLPRVIQLARQADVVHTQLFWANLLGRLAGFVAGRPIFTTLQTTAYDDKNIADQPFRIRQKIKILRLLDLLTSRMVTHFFAVSEATKRTYSRVFRLPEDFFEVLHNTVDLSRFDPNAQEDRTLIRNRLGVSEGEILLLTAARLIPTKRIEDAIHVTKELSQHKPVRLLVAGTGPCEAELKSLAQQISSPVTFLGARDDVPQLLFAADFFVFPSLFEGLPLALIEAMAMGLPCVCTNIPENQEVCGDAAVYFPPTDLAAFRQVLEELIDSKPTQKSLSEKARANAKRFDAQAIAEKFIQSIKSHIQT